MAISWWIEERDLMAIERQSQSFVVGVGVGIFFVHLIVLCFLFLHFILFFCLLP